MDKETKKTQPNKQTNKEGQYTYLLESRPTLIVEVHCLRDKKYMASFEFERNTSDHSNSMGSCSEFAFMLKAFTISVILQTYVSTVFSSSHIHANAIPRALLHSPSLLIRYTPEPESPGLKNGGSGLAKL